MRLRLTDIVSVMKSKWTYGDSFFGYTEELNDNHNTRYPSMLVTPPDSVFPEFRSNNGWEEFSFTIFFSDLYQRTQQANETIEQRWDNLQDLANEWLDMFLKNYQDSTVQAWLDDESLSIERRKEVANDQLLQIRMSFTWKANTRCFMPFTEYPSDVSNLVIWLKADSGLTYSTPTKRVSLWLDQSGANNHVRQATTESQPLRFTYDGALDKTRLSFDGVNDFLETSNNAPITGNDMTIFYVAKANSASTLTQRVIGYRESTATADRLNLGVDTNGRILFKAVDDNGEVGSITSAPLDLGTTHHIVSARIHNHTFRLQYNNNTEVHQTFAQFNNDDGFTDDKLRIGNIQLGGADTHFKGDIQEIIIYNKYLSNTERDLVRNYLNRKFKIY
tara:strand:+ start:3567 stop:4736 length:1170 start_codon:yes stop_codon:yes gene_type:complete